MKKWYEVLFENYARKYDEEVFVKGTLGECDFIERELSHDKFLRILDVGCGTGRHAIELAKRGYDVTGIDLSEAQLARARQKAEEAGVDVEFLRLDAREMPFQNQFDSSIMLCEGGFSLMETDEMNYQILKGVARALRTPGKFIFTALNGLFPLYHSIEQFMAEGQEDGKAAYRSSTFDLMTFRNHSTVTIIDDDDKKVELRANERFYVPSEITWLLKSLGFKDISIFGARLGEFSREHKLTTEDFEMLVVASC